MDQSRSVELQYRIEHRHPDGSWSEMAEERRPHDAADDDQERSWGLRRFFRCPRCDEQVTLEPGPEGDQPQ
jgi:hypothetical protein